MSDKRLQMPTNLGQFTLRFSYLGQQCRNVLYALCFDNMLAPTPWTNSNLQEYATALGTSYKDAYQSLTARDATFDKTSYVGNSVAGAGPLLEGDDDGTVGPWSGGEAHDGCASNVSLAIKLNTAFGGRSFHGRFYFVGINNGLYDVDNPNVLKAGAVTDFSVANEAFYNANSDYPLLDTNRVTLAVGSFVHSGSARTPAVGTPVSQITLTDNIFDAQRRRLPGRGI